MMGIDALLSSPRDTWDNVWMDIAWAISRMSYHPRTKVGAIIVADDNTRMLSLGYNGTYSGARNEVASRNVYD